MKHDLCCLALTMEQIVVLPNSLRFNCLVMYLVNELFAFHLIGEHHIYLLKPAKDIFEETIG